MAKKTFLQTKYNKVTKSVEQDKDGKWVSEFLEVNNGPVLVDKAFIPAKVQIEQAIAAGEDLRGFQIAMYHALNPEEIPDDYYDPLCIPNYDPTDAQADLRRIAARAWQRRKDKLAQEEEEENAQSEGDSQDTEGDAGVDNNPVVSGNDGEEGA